MAGIAITPTILSNIEIEEDDFIVEEEKEAKYFLLYNPNTFEPEIARIVEGEPPMYRSYNDFTEEELRKMKIERKY